MWTRANAVCEHGAENALLKMAENRRQNGLQKKPPSRPLQYVSLNRALWTTLGLKILEVLKKDPAESANLDRKTP